MWTEQGNSRSDKVARIERFEELLAWQKARVLTRLIYQATRKQAFSRDFGLSGQIQRAALSMMSNVAEGLSAAAEANFINFFRQRKHRVRNFGLNCTLRWTSDI